jgi:hypothetical protein
LATQIQEYNDHSYSKYNNWNMFLMWCRFCPPKPTREATTPGSVDECVAAIREARAVATEGIGAAGAGAYEGAEILSMVSPLLFEKDVFCPAYGVFNN